MIELDQTVIPIEDCEQSTTLPDIVARGDAVLYGIVGDHEPESLEGWRVVIDELDFSLMAVMAARIKATGAVSRLKAEQGLPGIDLRRENEIIQTANHAGAILGIDQRAVRGIFLAMIERAHGQHKRARQIKPAE